MTPDFALSLSFDGLRLLMRGDAGWLLVGEVSLDARDMRAALADLRHRGERLAGGPFEAKLLIPNEQIRYLALDGTTVTEEQVQAALDGATPYPVPDLVYDYTKGGGRTYVAAVARETLAEAEAFAREHGITPVSFAAVPDPFTFVGEVVFGPVSTDPGRVVTRDPDPVRVVGRAHHPAQDDPADTSNAAAAAPLPEGRGSAAVEAEPHDPTADPDTTERQPAEAITTPAPIDAAPLSDTATAPGMADPAPLRDLATAEVDTDPPGGRSDLAEGLTPGMADPRDPDPAPTPGDLPHDGAEEPSERAVGAAAGPTAAASTQEQDRRPAPGTRADHLDEALSPGAAEDTPAEAEQAPAALPVFASRRARALAAGDPGSEDLPLGAAAAAGVEPAAPPAARRSATPPMVERPAIFSRAARTPQPPAPRVDPVAAARAAAPDTGAPPPVVPAAAPPPPDPAAPPLRIERAAPVARKPAFLDGLPKADEPPPPPRPSWRETLAQRMRGRTAETAASETGPRPRGKRLPLSFASQSGDKPVPAITSAEARAPGAASTLSATRTADVAPAAAMPRPVPALPDAAAGSARLAERPAPAVQPPSPPASIPEAPRGAAMAVARGIPDGVPAPRPDPAARVTQSPPSEETPAPKTSRKPRILRRAQGAGAAASLSGDPQGERARMTVFGARRAEESRTVGGKPRYLGLLLTVILLVAMAVVAAMAGAPEALSRLFAPRDATTEIAAAPATAGGQTLSIGAPPIAVPAAPGAPIAVPDRAPAAAVPEPAVPPEVVDTTPEPMAIDPPAPAPDPDTPRRAATPAGQVLSPAEAQRIYAATGVWQRAPRIPVTPRPDDAANLVTSPIDAPGRPPLPGRPADVARALTDVRIPTPADPPPPGTGFERDARGFILATPEGTRTPDGILVYAGAPPLMPALRPGTAPPPSDATALAPEGAAREVSAGALVIAAEPDLVPPVRPDDLPSAETPPTGSASRDVAAAPGDAAPPPAAAEAAPDGVALVAVPAIVPPVRPATVTARAIASNGAETPAPPADATAASSAQPDQPAPALTGAEAGISAPSGVAFIETRAIRPPARPADLAPAPAPRDEGSAPAPASSPTDASDILAPGRAALPTDVVFVSTRAIRPPARPGSRAPAPATDPAAAAPPPTGVAAQPAVLVRTPAVTPPVRSAEIVARAADRLEVERAAIAARAASVRVVDTTPGGVSLAALDPPLRPQSILASARIAVAPSGTGTATETSLRPRPRPGDPAASTDLAAAEEAADDAAAEATAQRNAELLAAAAAAADALGASVPGLATATPRAVASSIRPDARPRNMATLVQRARQQQQREQARAAPAAAAAAAPQSTAATRVQPSGQTSTTVAAAATIDNAINLGRINLIGVYGRLDDRRALVRLPGGRYVRVAVGDRLDGGQVSSIGDGFITYARGGRNVRLDLPG